MPTKVKEIREGEVVLIHESKSGEGSGEEETIDNEHVFAMIGREAPLEFFRKSNVRIRGERTTVVVGFSLVGFLLFCVWLFHWKAPKPLFGFDALDVSRDRPLAQRGTRAGMILRWVQATLGGSGEQSGGVLHGCEQRWRNAAALDSVASPGHFITRLSYCRDAW